jgi:hypothetical protein
MENMNYMSLLMINFAAWVLLDHFVVCKRAVEFRIKNLKLFPPSKMRGVLYKNKKLLIA